MTETTSHTPAALLLDTLSEIEEMHPDTAPLAKEAAMHLARILAGIDRVYD